MRVGGEFRRHQMNGNLQEDKHGRIRTKSWFEFLTVGFKDPADKNRARQMNDIILNYGQTIRGYRMSDYNAFLADDWKVGPNLTFNVGVRWEYFGFPYEVNGMLSTFDFHGGDGYREGRRRLPVRVELQARVSPGWAGANLRLADSRSIQTRRLQQLHASHRLRLVSRR